MPKILRGFTRLCFAFFLFLPLALIPGAGFGINGQKVTFEEFWRRGGGPAFVVAGILFPLCGYGFVRARRWSRYLFAALQIGTLLSMLFIGGLDWQLWLGVGWAAFVVYYLFCVSSVREYFEK